MGFEEGDHFRQGRNEVVRQLSVRRVADDDQYSGLMLDDSREFIRLITDSSVMREGDPPALCNFWQPDSVVAIRREVICVAFYCKPGGAQDGWKLMTEIAVREEDNAQAARS